MKRLLNFLQASLGFLSLGLFLVAEIHAWWVLLDFGNPDHGWILNHGSIVPMQFVLMSYRVGSGAFADLGYLLPGGFLASLGLYLVVRRARRTGKSSLA